MIVITGTMDINPKRRPEFLEALRQLSEATVVEAGCVRYVFSADLDDPGRLHVHEQWESAETLDAHLASAHMKAFQRAVPNLGIRGADITRHEVTSSAPMFG